MSRLYDNFKFDLEVGMVAEELLRDILDNKKIEVKWDFMAPETGNVYIEYQYMDKPSGISKTEADYYCIRIGEVMHMISTGELKSRCRKYVGTKRDVKGGDDGLTRGILLPIKELMK